jgi:hypothetical protein
VFTMSCFTYPPSCALTWTRIFETSARRCSTPPPRTILCGDGVELKGVS